MERKKKLCSEFTKEDVIRSNHWKFILIENILLFYKGFPIYEVSDYK